jgi:hypothetical protein
MPLSKIDSDSLNSGAVANQDLGTPTALVATNASGTANALNAGIAVNQTWQNLTASRALSTTYTNSTGKPIYFSVRGVATSAASTWAATIGGVEIAKGWASNQLDSDMCSVGGLVPPGSTYSVSMTVGAATLSAWLELR